LPRRSKVNHGLYCRPWLSRRVTKRAMARAAMVIATAIRMAGDKEGDGKGGKGNDNSNEGGGGLKGQS
jgi:hypothetical protein